MIAGVALGAASVSYACSLALGLAVASGLVDSRPFHWLHHALYVATFALAAAAIAAGLWRRPLAGWLLLPVVVPFALIPFLGTRGVRHPVAGLVPVPFYVAAAVALLSQ